MFDDPIMDALSHGTYHHIGVVNVWFVLSATAAAAVETVRIALTGASVGGTGSF